MRKTLAPRSRLNRWLRSELYVLGHKGRNTRASLIEGVKSHCSTSVIADLHGRRSLIEIVDDQNDVMEGGGRISLFRDPG